jgi:hypothetical protein
VQLVVASWKVPKERIVFLWTCKTQLFVKRQRSKRESKTAIRIFKQLKIRFQLEKFDQCTNVILPQKQHYHLDFAGDLHEQSLLH